MRTLSLACLALAASLALVTEGRAQQPPPPVRMKFERVKLGFRSGAADEPGGTFKPGMWVPVHVTLKAAPDGPIVLPVRLDKTVEGEIRVETPDSDGVPTVYPEAFKHRAAERIHLITYTKVAATNPEIKVSLRPGGEGARGQDIPFLGNVERADGREVGEHLYLTLGSRLPQLQKGLAEATANPQDATDTKPCYLAHETEVERLPTRWFGYDPIDLAILTTDNKAFLDDLLKTANRPRIEALAEWVRRGGRLVVSVSWRNQELVQRLLTNRAPYEPWQPPLPEILVLPAGGQPYVKTFHSGQNWARDAGNKPFFKIGDAPLFVAQFQAGPRVEVDPRFSESAFVSRNVKGEKVEEALADKLPMIVRTPYGRGCITFLAFDVEKAPFTTWKGAPDFWKTVVSRLAPKVLRQRADVEGKAPGRRFNPRGEAEASDLTTRLQQELDTFDTPPISFGWVALFILLYILVVGPLDYLLLKKVFKRLELTWITFPAVVLTISLIAYFTAYAVKGKDLKVNKLDLVDLDLRTDLGEDLRTRQATAYGTTWFTILSPRIQNYTVGVEPVFPRQVEGAAREAPPALVSWLGRPEPGGMGASGRRQSQGLFTRTYQYAPDAAGLKDVPIPVWTTKSFTANWKAALKKLPFEAKLEYDPGDPDRTVSGTIKSNLPANLQDVMLVYGDKFYPLPDCEAGGRPLKVDLRQLQQQRALGISSWSQERAGQPNFDPEDAVPFDPGQVLKELLFHEKGGTFGQLNNSVQRRLDASWRLPEDWQGKPTVREAILVGRVPRARGAAETLTGDNDPRLATHLWLGALPGGEQGRPSLSGHLVQDTYVRVFLPVTPRKQ